MKGILFFLVLLGIILVIWNMSTKEGFQEMPGELKIPLISPRYQTLVEGEVQDFAPPSATLLAPPPGQSASVNTKPDADPAMQKSSSGRIQSVHESLTGFFKTDAPGLQKLGEPSVQLPLSTARSDLQRLKDEMNVLSRNPGLESSLTSEDLDGIESNMGYLQNKWRMSVNSMSGAEGFQSGSGSGSGSGPSPMESMGSMGSTSPMGSMRGGSVGSGSAPAMPAFVSALENPPPRGTAGSGSPGGSGVCPPPTQVTLFGASTINGVSLGTSISVPFTLSGNMCVQSCPTGYTTNTAAGMCEMTGTGGKSYLYTSDLKTVTPIMPGSGSGSGSGPRQMGSTPGPSTAPMGSGHTGSAHMGSGHTGSAHMGSAHMGSGSASGSRGSSKRSDVTLKDLQDLSLRINIEIIRLTNSGAADSFVDMNLQSRVNVLNQIKKTIDDMITKIQNGSMKIEDVPFMKADVDTFLPAMKNMNTPLPNLIKETGVSSYLNSLFPMFGAGDVSGANLAKKFFSDYSDTIFNNLSWDLSLHYVGQAEQTVANNYANAARDLKFASEDSGIPGTLEKGISGAPAHSYRGAMASVVQSITGVPTTAGGASVHPGASRHPGASAHHGASQHAGGSNSPATFDWKERSKQICQQINARGFKPYDFGCLEDPDNMRHESFSWRGYTKMVCNRLSTIYDPSVPFLCGCPPPTWPGWRQ
jgi:hypothetical protein